MDIYRQLQLKTIKKFERVTEMDIKKKNFFTVSNAIYGIVFIDP